MSFAKLDNIGSIESFADNKVCTLDYMIIPVYLWFKEAKLTVKNTPMKALLLSKFYLHH